MDATIPSVLAHLAVLHQRVKEWIELSHRLSDRAVYHPHTLGIAAVDYLMYCGYLTLADHWLHMEHTSYTLLQDKEYLSAHPERREFLETKLQVGSHFSSTSHLVFLQTAQFVFEYLLPRTLALKESMFASSASVMNISNFSAAYQPPGQEVKRRER